MHKAQPRHELGYKHRYKKYIKQDAASGKMIVLQEYLGQSYTATSNSCFWFQAPGLLNSKDTAASLNVCQMAYQIHIFDHSQGHQVKKYSIYIEFTVFGSHLVVGYLTTFPQNLHFPLFLGQPDSLRISYIKVLVF